MKVRRCLLAVLVAVSTLVASSLPALAVEPAEFTASISIVQLGRTNIDLGESGRLKTVNEVFTGAVTSTSWVLLEGATGELSDTTNTVIDWATGEISGTMQGKIVLVRGDGSTLEIGIGGKISGNLYTGGVMTGGWTVVGGTGVFDGYAARGTFEATAAMVWDPYPHLEGVTTLSGSYN